MDENDVRNTQLIGPVLWREKYIILASIVVMAAVAVAYALAAPKTYQATAILQVNLTTATPGTTDTTNADQALAQSYSTLLTSPGFLNRVRPHVEGGKLSVEQLKSRLTATTHSALIELRATGPSPAKAQTLGQQVIKGFVSNLQTAASSRTSQLEAQLQQSIANLSGQIGSLQAGGTGSLEQISSLRASRQALINQNATLIANGLAYGTSATESAPPVASSSPVSPKRTLDVIAGLLLGALLGVGLAWARHRLRPAIHSSDEVSALVDLPVLASVPLQSRFDPDDPALAEAHGVLYANLRFSVGNDVRIVTFVGFNPQVGKTSTVEGVAKVASRGDRRVLAVDGDMRMASLSERLGCRDHPGIVEVLEDSISLDSALVEIDENFWVLPARPSSANAATLLSGSRSAAVMAQLRERFDFVFIDTPPLSGLADGLILASQSDLAVLVLRAGVTKPGDAVSASNSLLQNMTPVAGLVVLEEVERKRYYGSAEPTRQRPAASVTP